MALMIQYAGICFRGITNQKNESNILCVEQYLPLVHSDMETAFSGRVDTVKQPVFAVADGRGPYEQGDAAAYLAMKELANNDGVHMRDKCSRINKKIYKFAEKKRVYGEGATIAAIEFGKHQITSINLGDSKVFFLRNDVLEQVSQHDGSNCILEDASDPQYLGIPESVRQMDCHEQQFAIESGDQFLICTNGLSETLGTRCMQEVLMINDYTEAEKVLLFKKMMKKQGGADNISVVICRVE